MRVIMGGMEEEERVNNKIGQDFSLLQLIRFALPAVLTNLFTQIFKSLDDGLFVSRYVGKTALAGITILTPLQFFQYALNNLFAIGASNISSRKMGEGKQLEAKQVFTQICIAAFALGCFFALLINVFARQLLTFFGSDEELIGYGILSLRTVFLITPITLVNNVFNSYFSTAGKPSMGLICSIVNGAANIILDVVLIVVLKIGVLGACISTVAGEVLVFIIGLFFFSSRKNEIHFVSPGNDILANTLRSCKSGFPQSLNCLSLTFTSLLVNYQLLRFVGNDGIAANSIIGDLRRILTASFFGYNGCIGPIIAFNYGSHNKDRLKKLMKQNLIIWAGGSAFFCIIGLVFRNPLISIFLNANENTATFHDLTYLGLTLEFLAVPFFSGCIIVNRILAAVNLSRASTTLAIFRNVVMRVLTILLMPALFHAIGIWLAAPVCEFVSFLFAAWLVFYNGREFGIKE